MTPSLTLWKYELEWERRVEEAEATARARAAALQSLGADERIFLDRLAHRLGRLGSLPASQLTETTRVLGRVAYFGQKQSKSRDAS